MSEPVRTVWAVTYDEYENWHVEDVFETREDAELVAAAKGSSYLVDEFTLYAAGEGKHFRDRTTFHASVTLFRDGSTSSNGVQEWDATEFEHAPPDAAPSVTVYANLYDRPVSAHRDQWRIEARAATAEAAREALSENVTMVVDRLSRGLNPETGEPLHAEARHPGTLTDAEYRAFRYVGGKP